MSVLIKLLRSNKKKVNNSLEFNKVKSDIDDNESNNNIGFDKRIYLDPNDSCLYYLRGNEKMKIKDYAGAIEEYNHALELNPDDSEVYYNRGNIKYILGDDEGANRDWRKANELGFADINKNKKGNFGNKIKS